MTLPSMDANLSHNALTHNERVQRFYPELVLYCSCQSASFSHSWRFTKRSEGAGPPTLLFSGKTNVAALPSFVIERASQVTFGIRFLPWPRFHAGQITEFPKQVTTLCPYSLQLLNTESEAAALVANST